jgi:hypothetical protein
MAENPRESNELIESLAALEHEQWIAWSKAVAPEVSEDRRKRWETYWVPYNDLDEDVKENDREWARKVAEIIAPDNGDLTVPDNGLEPGYTIGMDVAKPGSDRTAITLHLDVDVSDALTGLKALRREADRAVAALKALEEARRGTSEWDRYIAAVREITGKYYRERDVNYRVFKAVTEALHNRTNSTIQYERCEGATTSAVAAVKTFESAMLVVPYREVKEYIARELDMPHVCTEEEAQRDGLFRGVSVVIFDEGANLVDLPKNACYVRLVAKENDDLPLRPEVSE